MKTMHLVSAISLLVPAVAAAQPQAETTEASRGFDRPVAAPRNAFEVSVGTGYSQGGGPVGGAMLDLEDVSGPGAAVELGLGYRINPTFSIGAYGALATYDTGDRIDDSTSVLTAAAGIQAAAHLRPHRAVDPWVSLGAGWKALWLSPDQGKTTSLQGFDLARLQVGVDYRINESVAISPVIGGSLGLFVSQDSAMTSDYTEIEDKKVNFTGFAGIAGRFDIAGSR